MATAPSTFPAEWWQVTEIIFATSSFGEENYGEAIKSWRKANIGRTAALRARDFDNAVRGVKAAMAGRPDTIGDAMARGRWQLSRGISPTFARPAGWSYSRDELEVIRIARSREIEPVFLEYNTSGIDSVPGPATKPNPWDKWRRMT